VTWFPNNAAVIRLVGAILLDMHDEWVAAERLYLSEGSMAKLYTTGDNELVAALDSGAKAPRINLKAHHSAELYPSVRAFISLPLTGRTSRPVRPHCRFAVSSRRRMRPQHRLPE
jgi:Transposase, Mutator family